MSLLHVVMWRLAGPGEAERAAQAQTCVAAFEALRGQIEGLHAIDIGPNCIDGPDAWDLLLVMRFADRAALQRYNEHPAHLAIKQVMGPLRTARVVADIEV
jgi:hypothetical protein